MAEKRRVHGVVDRVEGEVIVVVVKDPDDGINKEIYVKKKQLKRIELKEGDNVTVEMSRMSADTESKTSWGRAWNQRFRQENPDGQFRGGERQTRQESG